MAPGLDVLFCGINPGLESAATNRHFARPGNRFYPALRRAGVLTRDVDLSRGMTDDDRRHFLDRGVGITNLVPRATARADELTGDELVAGARRLRHKAARYSPQVIAFLGLTAYRAAFGVPRAVVGPQKRTIGRSRTWLLPNPSGLNAHYQLPDLIRVFAELREWAR